MAKVILLILILSSTITHSADLFNYVYDDPEDRISDKFEVKKYFKKSVKFWFNIYTKYESQYSVIHDKNNFSIIYKTVKSKNKKKEMKKIRNTLLRLMNNKKKTAHATIIYNIIHKSRIKIPKNQKSKKLFYQKLIKNLRSQTGQRDMISNGLNNIQVFKPSISRYISLFRLPSELLAIPFLESSFNLRARSRVGATGVWQFMKRVGKYFMPINKYVDGRNNPIISSLSALHLLKQNLQVLKQWDLAIPAYNSGTKHLLRAKRSMKRKRVSLEKILKSYNHPHIGFASKNFYSEFLALVHALAYREKTFPIIKTNPLLKSINAKHIQVYVSKCSIGPQRLFHKLRKKSSQLKLLNSHIKNYHFKRFVPKGTIFISDIPLSKKRFHRVTDRNLVRSYPKNWLNLVRKKSCR